MIVHIKLNFQKISAIIPKNRVCTGKHGFSFKNQIGFLNFITTTAIIEAKLRVARVAYEMVVGA